MTQTNDTSPNPEWLLLGWILLCIIVCMLFSSCKTKTVVVEKVVDRYTHTTDTIRDSIRNDVFVKEYVKGDTVFVDKLQTLYKYVYRAKTDTFIQRDTIPYVVKQEVAKEKKLTLWQRIRLWLFLPMAMLLVIAFLIIKDLLRKKV
jgi:hypothetical protein